MKDEHSGDSHALYQKARDLLSSSQVELAVEVLSRSAAMSPHFKTLELLGECLVRLGRWQDSIIPLAAATTLNRQARAPALLSEAYLELKDLRRAKEMAEMSLHRNPTYRRPIELLSLIAAAQREEEEADDKNERERSENQSKPG